MSMVPRDNRGPAMLLDKARRAVLELRVVLLRRAVPQNLYIAALCLIYLMHNIWAARTLYYYIALPLALLAFDYGKLRSIVRNPIFVLSAAFLLVLFLTSLLAPVVNAKALGDHLLQTVRLLLFLLITAELLRKGDAFPVRLMLFVPVAAAIAAVINIAVFYGGEGFAHANWARRLEGVPGVTMYYNSNVVGAVYAIACVGGAALLARRALGRMANVLLLFATAILLATVLMTQSRGAILGMISGIAVIAFMAGNTKQRLLFAAAAGVFVAAVALGTPLIERMIERGAGLRPALWAHHLQLATQSPWIGHGMSFDVSIKEPGGGELSNAHNIFLSAFVRGGILAALTLAALVAVCLYRSFEAARRNGVLTPLALMATATAATSFDYEIAGSSLGWPWLLFWLPVGMCLAVASREAAEPSEMA